MTVVPLWFQIACTLGVAAVLLVQFQAIHAASVDNIELLRQHIRPPWLLSTFSLGVDLSDTQWGDFLSNVPLLGPVLLLFALGARFTRQYPPEVLQLYYIATGIVFIFFLHGATVTFMFAIMALNYAAACFLSRRVPYHIYQGINWTAHIALLYCNYVNGGYSFSLLSPSFMSLDTMLSARLRWHVVYNMSTLRMLAFNYDVWEANNFPQERRDKLEAKHHPNVCLDCAIQHRSGPSCYKYRMEMPRAESDFNFRAYFAYLCYIPLYVAGPMCSFNAFVSYTYTPTNLMTLREGVAYAFRIALTFVALMIELHFAYINAIVKTPAVFAALTTLQKSSLLFWTLSFLWMKFRIFWRFFRLIAIIDGVEVPEDMPRCFANTTTVQNFWKDWHASFNVWIVRYMYVPLGGTKRRLLSVFPIFLFIAFWHDIELSLFGWAIIMCISFVPEIVVTMFFSRPQWKHLPQSALFPYLRSFAGAASVMSLVVANIVGYGAGISNTGKGASEMLTGENMMLCVIAYLFFVCSGTIGWSHRDRADEAKRRLVVQYGIKERSCSPRITVRD